MFGAKEAAPQASRAERKRVPKAFRAAYEAGDLVGPVELLPPDTVHVTDGDGRSAAASASRR